MVFSRRDVHHSRAVAVRQDIGGRSSHAAVVASGAAEASVRKGEAIMKGLEVKDMRDRTWSSF